VNLLRRIGIGLLLLFLSGCAPTLTSLPHRYEVLTPPLDALWEKRTRADAPDTLQAIARIEVNAAGKRYPLKIALMLRRPALMRIESLPVIGPPDFFLSLNKESLKVFVPEKNEFYTGRPTKENLAFFFPLSLPPQDVVAIMMGTPPLTDKKIVKLEKSLAGSHYRLELLAADDTRQTLLLDYDDSRLRETQFLTPQGVILQRVTYSDYRPAGAVARPHHVTVYAPEKNTTVTIRYADLELGSGGDAASFDLPLPPGMAPIPLDKRGKEVLEE